LIWLFLLGISRLANGRFTPVEIVATFFMATFSLVGAASSLHLGRPLRPMKRFLAISLFALLQVAAMWFSFSKPIANR
jgi:DMSO reductase anchor subunit